MSDRGFIPAHRKVFDPDHHLAPSKRDPASRLHAWLDLCSLAMHEPRVVMGIELARGETRPLSVRFLANRWYWSKSRVARFTSDLEASTAIGTVRGTDYGTVYRIVNYDTYAPHGDSLRDTKRDSERDTRGTPAGQRETLEPLEEFSSPAQEGVSSLVERKVRGLYGHAGSEGMDPVLTKAFPDDINARDRCLDIALSRLDTEGLEYQGRLFRQVLVTVISEQKGEGFGSRGYGGRHDPLAITPEEQAQLDREAS